uniref:Uncharacterized protein n=1 Tax=Arundo donax TaxID=35708 RepID=A0A0A8Y9U7_ARUDO
MRRLHPGILISCGRRPRRRVRPWRWIPLPGRSLHRRRRAPLLPSGDRHHLPRLLPRAPLAGPRARHRGGAVRQPPRRPAQPPAPASTPAATAALVARRPLPLRRPPARGGPRHRGPLSAPVALILRAVAPPLMVEVVAPLGSSVPPVPTAVLARRRLPRGRRAPAEAAALDQYRVHLLLGAARRPHRRPAHRDGPRLLIRRRPLHPLLLHLAFRRGRDLGGRRRRGSLDDEHRPLVGRRLLRLG